jgi:hypothetical protein
MMHHSKVHVAKKQVLFFACFILLNSSQTAIIKSILVKWPAKDSKPPLHVGAKQMKMKTNIHALAIGIALISACLFTVDAITGIYVANSVERHLGKRLLAVADNPNLNKQLIEEFLKGVPPPRILYKEIFGTRQVMQRLSCDGFIFMFSVLIGYITRNKTGKPGDTSPPHSPSTPMANDR